MKFLLYLYIFSAQMGKDGKLNPCKPITKVEWKSVKNG